MHPSPGHVSKSIHCDSFRVKDAQKMLKCSSCRKCVWKNVEVCMCVTEHDHLHSGLRVPLGQASPCRSITC